MPVSVNDFISDRIIRHSVYIEGLKTHEVNKIMSFLNTSVIPDLRRQIRKRLDRIKKQGFDKGPITTGRLKQLKKETNLILREGILKSRKQFKSSLLDIADHEARWTTGLFDKAVPNELGLQFVAPSAQLLKTIVTSKPFEGKILRKWYNGLAGSTQRNLDKAVKIGLAEGETVAQVMTRVDKAIKLLRHNANAVARSAIAHTVNESRFATYKENDDVVKGWQFVATLDAGTTDICMAHDGNVYKIDEGGSDRPPLHFKCRSTTTPILKSWKELGIKAKEVSASTRESMNGAVSAKIKYPQWLKKQSKAFQNEALGPGKAAMFRRGHVKIEQFVDRRNRSIPLYKLEKLEKNIIRSKKRRKSA
jgi:SPP1 gp7 family putative phage head morphogenesis protein